MKCWKSETMLLLAAFLTHTNSNHKRNIVILCSGETAPDKDLLSAVFYFVVVVVVVVVLFCFFVPNSTKHKTTLNGNAASEHSVAGILRIFLWPLVESLGEKGGEVKGSICSNVAS